MSMGYTFQSLKQVLDVFQPSSSLGVTEISGKLGKSRAIIHKYVKELVLQGKLKKIGQGPGVKYSLTESLIDTTDVPIIKENALISFQEKKLLDEIFFKFSADGHILKGYDGMGKWCEERSLSLFEKKNSYISVHQHIESLRDHCGLLDAKNAFGKDFPQVFLDKVFYADQYNRIEFGRGKLAEMTFYAKQSQNLLLIGEVIGQILYKLQCLIQTNQYDALAFVPWSIERKNQLLKYLKQSLLPLGLPLVPIVKYAPSGIPIPQKTLKTREQRIQNAQNTIFVDDSKVGNYQKILLIDDFVGSGSTLNETAQKLKQLKIPRVDGFAFVGNLNLTYEVIREI